MIKAVSRATVGAALGVCMIGVAACSSSPGPARVVTVTVTPASRSTSGAPAPSAAPTTSHAATSLAALPGTCTLLPPVDIAHAMGNVALTGRAVFVVGTADKTIGRLAYLNCRYGVLGTGSAAKPRVEIGVSLYRSAAQATSRVAATVADYRAHGATVASVPVDGRSGWLLTGGQAPDHSDPLAVVADGQRSVAVSVDPTLAAGSVVGRDAAAVATLALRRTGS